MDKIFLSYLFQSLRNPLIKGNDYPLLIYILEKSIEKNFPQELELSSKEYQEITGVTKPTYYKSLENLKFAGIITYRKHDNPFSGFIIRVMFLRDLSKAIDKGDDSLNSVLQGYLPDFSRTTQYFSFREKNNPDTEEKSVFLSGKDSLYHFEHTGKDSLYRDKISYAGIDKDLLYMYNLCVDKDSLLVAVERAKEVYYRDKDSLFHSKDWYKVSLSFVSDGDLFKINELRNLIESNLTDTKRVLMKISGHIYKDYIYNNIILILCNIFNRFLFSGDLFNEIEKKLNTSKNKKTNKLLKKLFKFTDESIEMVPKELRNKSESVWGEEHKFLDAYQEWIDYRKIKKGNPVSYDEAIKDFKFLSLIEFPILSIQESMRKSAVGIFEVKNKENYHIENKHTNKESKKIGTIRKFD